MQPFVPPAVFVTKGGDSLFCPGPCLMAAVWGEHIDQGKKEKWQTLDSVKRSAVPCWVLTPAVMPKTSI